MRETFRSDEAFAVISWLIFCIDRTISFSHSGRKISIPKNQISANIDMNK